MNLYVFSRFIYRDYIKWLQTLVVHRGMCSRHIHVILASELEPV
jgi:hypothetical protein